jgi:predicted DNA-binding protein
MSASISLRLDQETRDRVERIARRKKVPASHILREAVNRVIEREEEGVFPYEAIQDLVGIARGGGARTLSKNTGHRFAELLQRRNQRR